MIDENAPITPRVLVVDDNPAIHSDFRKILCPDQSGQSELAQAEAALFGDDVDSTPGGPVFELDAATQGAEALEMVERAAAEGRPYALAFVDVRMPPGWDGIETSRKLWQAQPDLQVVICTAYSDYSWEKMSSEFGRCDRWLILKKPFDNVEVSQMASALTEKWRLTRALAQRVEDLEAAVAKRTRELAEQNAQLETALAKLQEAHAQLLQNDKMASIGQLAAGVAHEINNPIGFISSNLNSLHAYAEDLQKLLAGYAELTQLCADQGGELASRATELRDLERQADVEFMVGDLDDLINESIEGAHRVRQIVADLRDFSHVDNPDVTEEDINSLLDKTINVAWNELKYKAQVVREYGETPTIPCFGGQLGQVFLNLLVNAAQALGDRGTVTVRTGADADWLWVEIVDDGCGIPPENLQRIFEPFFTTKPVGQGTGMGLHLCYKIVDAHGGRIRAESVIDVGTTFRVELPLSGPELAGEATDEQSQSV